MTLTPSHSVNQLIALSVSVSLQAVFHVPSREATNHHNNNNHNNNNTTMMMMMMIDKTR